MRYGIVCGHLRRCNEIFAMRKGWYGAMGIFRDHGDGLALVAVPGEEGGVTLRRLSGLKTGWLNGR